MESQIFRFGRQLSFNFFLLTNLKIWEGLQPYSEISRRYQLTPNPGRKYMKQIKLFCLCVTLLPVITLLMISSSWATVSAVNITGCTHNENEPKALTQITISWSYANESIADTVTCFYYHIGIESEYTLTATNGTQLDSSKNSLQIPKEEGNYYFYIAGYKTYNAPIPPPEMGTVTTYGPIKIDTTPPENVEVNGPNLTTQEEILLGIGADEQLDQVCICETAYGICNDWKSLSTPQHSYLLKQGEMQYSLKIQVMDMAGNVANADPFDITYTTDEDIIMASYTSVPTLTQWGLIFFLSLLIFIGVKTTRRVVLSV